MDVGCINWILGLFVLFLLPSVISPRWVWQHTAAWSFRNPEANEPSDAGYATQRAGAVIAVVLIVGFMIALPRLAADSERSNQRQQYQDCLADHDAGQDEDLLSAEHQCEYLSPSPAGP